MLNFELCTETERREAAAIERRRAQDEERKKRIFGPNAKIFIDYAALDAQIAEKKQREQEERIRDLAFEERTRQYALLAKELEDKEKQERMKLHREVNVFRKMFQGKETRREADLDQEPLPARVFDEDPRCGISSMQTFQGEDRFAKARQKIQNEQTRVWLDQQMDEKERADQERHDADQAYMEATYARDQQARDLEHLEAECRARLSLACTEYNKALADERDRVRRLRRREDEQDDLAHKYNVMMSDMLLETDAPGADQSKAKGLSRAKRVALLEEQKALAAQAKARKDLEQRRDLEFNEYTNSMNMTIAAMDKDLARKKLEMSRNIAQENLRLSKEQHDKEVFLKKVVYTNRASEEFYAQFNKTAR